MSSLILLSLLVEEVNYLDGTNYGSASSSESNTDSEIDEEINNSDYDVSIKTIEVIFILVFAIFLIG